ncbi:MAG: hypothetical protein SPI34_00545 [Opitutales bacterium]|nr:hypothetical protein [Opitutales bacterium]
MLLLESGIAEFFPIMMIVLWVGFAVFGAIKTAKKQTQDTSKDFEMAKRRIEEIKRRNAQSRDGAKRGVPNEEPGSYKDFYDEIKKELESEKSATKPETFAKSAPKKEQPDAYSRKMPEMPAFEHFDYNKSLQEAERVLRQTQLRLENVHTKFAAKPKVAELVDNNSHLSELLKNKPFLKNAMVCAEVLGKPVALRDF